MSPRPPQESDAPSPLPGTWRWALPRILLLFVATRILLVALAMIVEATQPAPAAGVRWTESPILASLTAYDGRYYLGIALSGYHAAPVYGPYVDYAFFPLYPVLVRLASLLVLGNVDVAGVLVANASFGVALVALYALSIRHLTPETALVSLLYVALAPGAVAFGLAYSDSLFLLLAVGAILAAETRRPALAGGLYALATLARPPGILLGIALVLLFARERRLLRASALTWLALGPVALAGFAAYVGWLTGDLLAIIHAQGLWSRLVSGPAVDGGGSAAAGSGIAVGVTDGPPLVVALWLGVLLFSCFLFVFFRRDRIPSAHWVVAMIPIVSLFSAGRLMSAPRFLAVAWPFDWALATRRTRWVRVAVPAVFVGLQCLLAWLAFTWQAAP